MGLSNTRSVNLAALTCILATFACNAATGDLGKGEGKASKKGGGGALSPSVTVAVIGEKPITLQDVDAKAAPSLMQVRQQEYEVRRQALEGLINDQLVDQEARAKGIAPEALIKAEVTDKVAAPAQTEVEAFYEQNKTRFGAQTKEQVMPQIGNMLRQQKQMEVQRAFYKGLREKHGVKIMLEAPRVAVSLDDDPSKGPAKAPITIVEFSDYQCPYCSRAEATVDEVMKKYGDKVRLVYRDYPLAFHQNAETASQAAECAEEQGKFWEMHKAMFANQAKLTAPDLAETAAGIGVDKEKFKTCLDSGKYKTEVQKDFADGQKYGVTGTPTFFINGIPMVGAKGLDSFVEIIDAELERTN
jgi:protein-disulfide isomerase